MSPSYHFRDKFYIALPISIVDSYLSQGVFSHLDCMQAHSPRPSPLIGFPVSRRYVTSYVAFRRFRLGVAKAVVLDS